MEFETVVRRRHMVRAYQPRPVEDEQIARLLRLAHQAPSAGFKQPQEFIVVRDPTVKRALARAALDQAFVAEAPVAIVVCADTARSASRYGERGVHFYSIIDGAFAAMLILLGVVDEGLGGCFVGAFDDDEVSRVLGLPETVRPIGIIPLGYPAEAAEKYPRLPLERIVHQDRWGRHHTPIA
ncbi:MAG: nitroreductase family protein [Chloroflexi bacterium]|nr:nitroreductase family protein [Chloroflexota bacterium]